MVLMGIGILGVIFQYTMYAIVMLFCIKGIKAIDIYIDKNTH